MQKVSADVKERIALYATYTMLYINDMACNEIIFLEPYIKEEHKETKKIYGALQKRAKQYLSDIRKIIGNNNLYFSEYCSAMDDFCDERLEDFKKTVVYSLQQKGVEKYELVGRLESVRILTFHAVTSAEYLIQESTKVLASSQNLKKYILEDIKRVADNLSKWVWFYYKLPTIDVSDYNITDKVNALNEVLLKYEPFETAYTAASNADYDELKKLMNNG